MDDNASAHPADSHGAARNPNPDSFVPIDPLESRFDSIERGPSSLHVPVS